MAFSSSQSSGSYAGRRDRICDPEINDAGKIVKSTNYLTGLRRHLNECSLDVL